MVWKEMLGFEERTLDSDVAERFSSWTPNSFCHVWEDVFIFLPGKDMPFTKRQRQLIMIDGGLCNNEPLSFQGKFGGKFEVKPANLLLLLQT